MVFGQAPPFSRADRLTPLGGDATTLYDMSVMWHTPRSQVADAARRMYALGLVSGTAGNASVRLDAADADGRGLMAVTPASVRYEEMDAEDVVVTDFEMETVAGERAPSSESLLHAGIYARRAGVRAVVHTHSVYSSAFAVAHRDLPPALDEVLVYVGGAVNVSEYGFPGSQDLADNVCAALGENKAAFIANHGAVAVGESLDEALDICLLVERACQIYILAQSLGGAVPIPTRFADAETAIYRMKNGLPPLADPRREPPRLGEAR